MIGLSKVAGDEMRCHLKCADYRLQVAGYRKKERGLYQITQ
jgi:hypothetical protein